MTLCRQVNDRVDIFLIKLVKFYLNNMANLHQLTLHIMPSYTHKMAIVSWPQILWRHFTLCIENTYLLTYLRECVRACVHPSVPGHSLTGLSLTSTVGNISVLHTLRRLGQLTALIMHFTKHVSRTASNARPQPRPRHHTQQTVANTSNICDR